MAGPEHTLQGFQIPDFLYNMWIARTGIDRQKQLKIDPHRKVRVVRPPRPCLHTTC